MIVFGLLIMLHVVACVFPPLWLAVVPLDILLYREAKVRKARYRRAKLEADWFTQSAKWVSR